MDPRNTDISLEESTEKGAEVGVITLQLEDLDLTSASQKQPLIVHQTGRQKFLNADINSAAALRAQYGIEIPKPTRRRHKKMTTKVLDDNDQPVVDRTAALPLHSKKTERLQRKQQKKSERLAYQQSTITSLLSLPSELLLEIFANLLPTDIASLLQTNHDLHTFITNEEPSIARDIIRRRYWTLYRCFPLPILFADVPEDAHAALLSPRRQEMLNIHRKPYQHVQMIDPLDICTCLTCVFAWNNLCLIVDLHHWQHHLENREPLPIIPRGTNPSWNSDLLSRNAAMVRQAIDRPVVYARILQLHLDTITKTIQRNSRWRKKSTAFVNSSSNSSSSSSSNISTNNTNTKSTFSSINPNFNLNLNPLIPSPSPSPSPSITTPTSLQVSTTPSKPNLYHLTALDAATDTDAYLDRTGPPSYDFPYMRDNYYSLEAYLPNRRWSSASGSWHYWGLPPLQHERDLEWVRSWALGAGWKG